MEKGKKFEQNTGFGYDFRNFQPLGDPIILPNGRVINPREPSIRRSEPVPNTGRARRTSGQRNR